MRNNRLPEPVIRVKQPALARFSPDVAPLFVHFRADDDVTARLYARGYRVFSQVSLGEILGSDDKQAYLAINSKRADFVIIDWSGQPIAVVEYHGSGHFQGDAVVRDAVKREACASAGIAFIELTASYSDDDIKAISDHLSAKAA